MTHGIENKLVIGLLNVVVNKLDDLNLKLNNLDRKLNYTIYRIFLMNREPSKIGESITKVSSDLQRIITLERMLTTLLNR